MKADGASVSHPSEPLLCVESLRFGPAGRALVEPVSFTLERGRCLVLLGPNGAGKTSLMRTLIGALSPLGGSIRWDGRALADLTERERASLMAFAAPRPVDEGAFTVLHLVLLGRMAARGMFAGPSSVDLQRAHDALTELGLDRLCERTLAQLSEGERQLAQIGRALAQDALALLLDEPAASLDLARQAALLTTVRRLTEGRRAVVLSTHDPNHALAVADQVLLWQAPGRIAWGPASQLLEPAVLSAAYGVEVKRHRAEDGAVMFGIGQRQPGPLLPSSDKTASIRF
ncbi:MAG: ABC transporter ATP-binding protein [Betaproteobacteria bacterium]|nr:ABC transporter ATP-binding protein [Betaproteobacteria bacterium]